MKITHVSTSDISGGAARAAYRLHQGLLAVGEASTMFVQRRESNDPGVLGFRYPDGLRTRLYRGTRHWLLQRESRRLLSHRPSGASFFSDDRTEHLAAALNQLPECDVLHLHWFSGFLDYKATFSCIPRDKPLVWTFHDMNGFTGGCHFDNGCGKFAESCGACPELNSADPRDFSHASWKRKQAAYQNLSSSNFRLVAPSNWLSREIRKSSLLSRFPVSVIPYGLDTDIFQSRDRRAARDILGLPADAKVILFVADWATEVRKGFDLLKAVLSSLRGTIGLRLLAIGQGNIELPPEIPSLRLEYIREERMLSMIYSAADIFVLPARQDNLPNTVLEALACGVPVAAFQVGGVSEIIRDGIEGRLVNPGDVGALRAAICQILDNDDTRKSMAFNARKRAVQEYGLELQANRYLELYRSLVAPAPS